MSYPLDINKMIETIQRYGIGNKNVNLLRLYFTLQYSIKRNDDRKNNKKYFNISNIDFVNTMVDILLDLTGYEYKKDKINANT